MSLAFCRDCLTGAPVTATGDLEWQRCHTCNSPRLVCHPELDQLAIAHVDCDAFYAAVEKRDNPELKDRPVIIGGGKRGVVATACYVARIYGIHSAMPMFKALKACPHAVVLKPNITKYSAVGREIRKLFGEVTPQVEPVSIDEAFLDLTGTERLHKQSAAVTMARLAQRIEQQIGITVSVGLSYNKFLAKIASDLDKPRGFSVIGQTDAIARLGALSVSKIPGVGKVLQAKLKGDGIERIRQLQAADLQFLVDRYGNAGQWLANLAHGRDTRPVKPRSRAKSLSCETTFDSDIADKETLLRHLWRLCEKLAGRAKSGRKVGKTVTLKLKTADFRIRTRSRTLARPTQRSETLYAHAKELLLPEADGTAFRLIGMGLSGLQEDPEAQDADLFDVADTRQTESERAIDLVRQKFGDQAIMKGRSMRKARAFSGKVDPVFRPKTRPN